MDDNRVTEFIDEPDTIRNEVVDNGLLMTGNQTTELRKLLEERGVKWTSKPTCPETTWAHNGWWYNAKFEPWSDSTFKVILYDLTPEQAIAATLGGGTCECVVEYAKSPLDGKTIVLHRCSACNELMRPHMNYCQNCGRKVVNE